MQEQHSKKDVFDLELWRMRRHRAASHFARYAFLHQYVWQETCDRLMDFTHGFERVLVIGLRLSDDLSSLMGAFEKKKIDPELTLCALTDEEVETFSSWKKEFSNIDIVKMENEVFPKTSQKHDLVIHHLHGHICNDLPGLMHQMQSVMAPDAVYLGSLFGGDSLMALRQSLAHAEMEILGGIAPHISPFATLQDAGALMQRCHFTLPVVDYDTIAVSYRNITSLMHDLRYMGEGNCLSQQAKRPLRRDVLELANDYYLQHFPAQEAGKIRCEFDVIYLTGRKASSKQQSPLKPGQGDVNLADVLAAMPVVEAE